MAVVLFVCGGNVGRSQIAEAFFNHYTKNSVARSCAGNMYETNSKISEQNSRIMNQEYGIDMSDQIPKPYDQNMVDNSDYVFTLCGKSKCPIIPRAKHWNIPNMGNLEFTERREVISLINKKVRAFVRELGE